MITFDFGWKTVIALGGAAATVILVSKIKPADITAGFYCCATFAFFF